MNRTSITPERVPNPPTRLYFPNRDGSPRWVWPADNRRPLFLDFYQATSVRQRITVLLIRLVFFLRLQRRLFPVVQNKVGIDVPGREWALFTGTVGPNRKRVVLSGKSVVKTAMGPLSAANLKNESRALRRLEASRGSVTFNFPRLERSRPNELVMEKLAATGTWDRFTDRHAEALEDLRMLDSSAGPVGAWSGWETIQERLGRLEAEPGNRFPSGLLRNFGCMVRAMPTEHYAVFGSTHGDFTPWNTLRSPDGSLALIDWELAGDNLPAGFDFFHFHLQQGILVARKNWKAIYADIQNELTPLRRLQLFGMNEPDVDNFLRLYLASHVSYYLELYRAQPEWHEQVYWQLDVWADAILALTPQRDDRTKLISRLFDLLDGRRYAVLKLGDANPLDLPATSDLDILIGVEDGRELLRKLNDCPLVSGSHIVRQSFMTSVCLRLTDGQLLHLDLIRKVKRRATVFQDAAALIDRSRINRHGISVVSDADTEQYLRLFYGLNGSPIPAKYDIAPGPVPVPALRENRGWRKIANHLSYAVDTVRTMLIDPGYVITFSGVDGAGKSTVIAAVTDILDKEIRRPVKVLRHRPSILPILSAYVHGRAGAEQRSVQSLPRTGTNRNTLSSALRFAYYYADYVLGQWYVHLRYVRRGYVVVYDRYYYDFILDGRRSNISLPEGLVRAGFNLIRKPDYNFFLYADPEVILARKRELDGKTIVDLTRRYRKLFTRYAEQYPDRVFANVENLILEDTLALIRTTLKAKIC